MTTGLDLKVERVRADVRARRIAEIMGVSRERVSAIERSRTVTPEAERRYRAALAVAKGELG